MTPWEAAKLAIQTGAAFAGEFVRLARSGELDRRFFWYGVEGAREYVAMIAAGDIAPDPVIDARRAECAACPSRTFDERQRASYCGPKLQERLGEDPPTCGCPVEAATACASKSCPQGRWEAVQVRVNARALPGAGPEPGQEI